MNSAHREVYKEYGRRFKRAISGLFGRASKRARLSAPMGRMSSSRARSFSKGYQLVKQRAVPLKKRYRKSKRSRIIRLKRRKNKLAGIAGKLLSRMWKRLVYVRERSQQEQRGAVAMPNVIADYSGVLNDRWHYMPLQLYDITNVNTGGTAHNIGYSLLYNRSTNRPADGMDYRVWPGGFVKDTLDGDGSTGDSYSVVSGLNAYNAFSSTDSSKYSNAEKVYQHGVNIDLILYGQAKIDTHYRIDVVKFDKKFIEWMMADTLSPTTDPFTQDKNDSPSFGDWRQFWHALVSPYTQNPLIERYRGKFMKIIKSYTFDIPEQSSDYESTPGVRTRIKVPMNRLRDRVWHRGTDTGQNTTDPERHLTLNDADYDSVNPALQVTPINAIRPQDRVFLMIRANSVDQVTEIATQTTNITAGECPTYDIKITSTYSVS